MSTQSSSKVGEGSPLVDAVQQMLRDAMPGIYLTSGDGRKYGPARITYERGQGGVVVDPSGQPMTHPKENRKMSVVDVIDHLNKRRGKSMFMKHREGPINEILMTGPGVLSVTYPNTGTTHPFDGLWGIFTNPKTVFSLTREALEGKDVIPPSGTISDITIKYKEPIDTSEDDEEEDEDDDLYDQISIVAESTVDSTIERLLR